MKKILVLVCTFLVCTAPLFCQKKELLPITADSLATGNYKDVLKSFFQLGFEKFTGPDKELKFTSNPYAVMAKMDTSLFLSSNYYKLRNLRKLNFGFSVKLDSSYKFNGFSSEIKYALINKRDETVSWAFVSMILGDEKIKNFFNLNNFLIANVSKFTQDRDLQKKMIDDARLFMQGKLKFSKLDAELQVAIKEHLTKENLTEIAEIINTNDFNPTKISSEIYKKFKETINNKLLWTVSISDTTYRDKFEFSSVLLSTEIVKGIDKARKADIELNISSNLLYADDSTKSGRNLKRSIFSFEPGLNFVAKTENGMKSFLEFKMGGGYYRVFSGLYSGEDREKITLNGTLRIRIFNDIWIPVEIKYEPKTGNVFGFLNVRSNFTSLKKFISQWSR
jgi:hypothetical protein